MPKWRWPSARANLANTVRKVRGLYSSVNGAQADVAARKTAVDKARADYNRRVALAKSGAISSEELSHASDALTTAESALITAQQQYQTSKVLVDDTVVASHPDVQAAAAQSCARPFSTTRAPPWSRRWTAMWPNARCRSASACSRAPR